MTTVVAEVIPVTEDAEEWRAFWDWYLFGDPFSTPPASQSLEHA